MTDGHTILAFDTSGPYCAAALLRDGVIEKVTCEAMTRGQAERLMPLLEEMLAAQNLSWSDIDRIAVGVGPGNFTGIRIAVSAARGLALGLGIPACGVSTFETTRALGKWAQVAVPAPRGAAYLMDFDKQLDPARASTLPPGYAVSSDHPPEDHVAEMARIAATRTDGPAPSPLYVRPADAAPPREAPPRILDDA